MTDNQDGFHATELYLLAKAFDAEVIFGLPDKKVYQLQGEAPFRTAYERLIAKGLLTSEGKMTKTGAVIIKTLSEYFFSRKYVRVNNIMAAFRPDNEDELILLIEKERETDYRLSIMAKPYVLKLLTDAFPIITRDPKEEEKTFIKQELAEEETHTIRQQQIPENVIGIECFHKYETPQIQSNSNYYQHWLVFTDTENQLIMVDPQNMIYYHASQHWLVTKIFDAFEFPYEKRGGLAYE